MLDDPFQAAFIGGVVGSVITLAGILWKFAEAWGKRGEKVGELTRAVREVDEDNDDLEQRVRSNKELLDRHIGAHKSRGHSMCTGSEE